MENTITDTAVQLTCAPTFLSLLSGPLPTVRIGAWQVERVAAATATGATVRVRHPEYATAKSPEPGFFGGGHLDDASPMTSDASTVVDPVPGRQM